MESPGLSFQFLCCEVPNNRTFSKHALYREVSEKRTVDMSQVDSKRHRTTSRHPIERILALCSNRYALFAGNIPVLGMHSWAHNILACPCLMAAVHLSNHPLAVCAPDPGSSCDEQLCQALTSVSN